ncbi:MAG TPA: 23S rRNA (guanosine(2251)-2'-O)-methyltransferase RlmB [Solirubrobacteraceae bacterium]|nr:23S rRNA (guanosine(2251)-2'-O)-methyltransferase RlmB [Solirubrobacteraceae bacterium]
MILYGRNPVAEALRGGRARSVQEIWATEPARREPWLQRARGAGVSVHGASAQEIELRCGSGAHQGVCALAGPYPYVGARELLERPSPLLVVLDQVQDPQNLGSICRTAECAGADGVVIAQRRAAEVTPAVCKASAGAVEHVRVARAANIADFLGDAARAGCWCYGASAGPRQGAGAPVAYDSPDYGDGGVVLVLGGEGTGLRPRVAGACDQLVALPMRGQVDSLGVAAAAAALLYAILQGRSRGVDKGP